MPILTNPATFLLMRTSTGAWRQLKYSQARHPQREALMNTRIISGSIWGDLTGICLFHILVDSLSQVACETAPTSSTFSMKHTRQCSGWVNITGWQCRPSLSFSTFFWHLPSCVPPAAVAEWDACQSYIVLPSNWGQLHPHFQQVSMVLMIDGPHLWLYGDSCERASIEVVCMNGCMNCSMPSSTAWCYSHFHYSQVHWLDFKLSQNTGSTSS